ncbi:MAG: type II secretion system F family protein [Atopobiaceae bacterium]|jgi:tight adherence protein B
MERAYGIALQLSCGAVAWLSAYVLSWQRPQPSQASSSRLRKRAWRIFAQICGCIACRGFVVALMRLEPWHAASKAISMSSVGKRPALDTRQACAALVVCCLGAVSACGLLSQSFIGALVPIGAVAIGVPLWDASHRRSEARQIAAEMPEALRTLALALSSGETLAQAIEYVGRNDAGPISRAFLQASMRLKCGSSAQEALTAFEKELRAPHVRLLVSALLIAQRTGSPLHGLLETSAELAERQGELERLLSVKTAQVRLSVRIVCLLPLLMIGILSLVSKDFQRGLATFVGAASVVCAVALDALALAIIRHLMKGVI